MNIGIIGSGSWGITIGRLLFFKENIITIWCRRLEKAEQLSRDREDPERLPGIRIPKGIKFTPDFNDLKNSQYIIFAVPSHTLREVASRLKSHFSPGRIISLIKGMEEKTFKTPSQILEELFPRAKIAVLSGPSIAREVAQELPTSVVSASEDVFYAQEVQELFHTGYFRVYYSQDIIGVELGAALKNIIAIAAGIIDGLNLGANAKGALLVRGIKEIMRIGEKLGANPLTFSGLSGTGDLITTCFSKYSRNRHVGEELAKGRKIQDILEEMKMVAEGVRTTFIVYELSKKLKVDMPITEFVYKILKGEITPRDAIKEILQRPPKPEF